jgi:hypothetical protein
VKRALIIGGIVIASLAVGVWFSLPRIAATLEERLAARQRQQNHLPEAALHALLTDPELSLFSIDPESGTAAAPGVPTFQRWPVLGQTTVVDPAQRQRLADTLQRGLNGWSGREIVGCFNPRHALRATEGNERFDFLICFECGWLYYYPPDSKEIHLCIRTKAGPFNDLLLAAKVPMTKPPSQP